MNSTTESVATNFNYPNRDIYMDIYTSTPCLKKLGKIIFLRT